MLTGLCILLAVLAIILLFGFVGCTATIEAAGFFVSLEYDVHDIAEPSTIIFHWTIDDVTNNGVGGPIRPGVTEGRMVSDFLIPEPRPGEWRIWCGVFLSSEMGDVELMRDGICELSIDEVIISRTVRFEVTRNDAGESVVRCAG